MSNKSYCMLCNAELISLIQPPTEYGYLCAPCKVAVLCVGKNQIDQIGKMSQNIQSFNAALGGPAFSGIHRLAHVYGHGTLGDIMKERQNQELHNTFSERAEKMKEGEDEK